MTKNNVLVGIVASALGYGFLDKAGYPEVFWVLTVSVLLAGALGVAYRNIA